MSKVLCVGELLWDLIPSGKVVGGAPFNVAYHLNKLGIESLICTRVGSDEDGDELITFVDNHCINTALIQIDKDYPTSVVNVIYDDREGIKYDIVKPVAWDFLEPIDYALEEQDYIVYGSLVFRNNVSKKSVLDFLKKSPAKKVVDLNLRAPHFDRDSTFEVLSRTDILKINREELQILLGWIDEERDIYSGTERLLEYFNLEEVLCTLGSKGVYYCSSHQNTRYAVNALEIDVVDTIGSGDSFLAGYLSAKISRKSTKESLQFASSVAGFVSTKKGGCPAYDLEELQKFQLNNAVI